MKDACIGGSFLNAIKAMYTSVRYCIELNDGLTSPIESIKGLKQGDVLSPMLFNLFINDLKDIFELILTHREGETKVCQSRKDYVPCTQTML